MSVVAILAPDVVQAVEKGETASLSPFTLTALNKTLEILQKVKGVTESDGENVFSQQQVAKYEQILLIHSSIIMFSLSHNSEIPSSSNLGYYRAVCRLSITSWYCATIAITSR